MGKDSLEGVGSYQLSKETELVSLYYCPSDIPQVQQCPEMMAAIQIVNLRLLHVRLLQKLVKQLSVDHQEVCTSLSVNIDHLVACLQQMVLE